MPRIMPILDTYKIQIKENSPGSSQKKRAHLKAVLSIPILYHAIRISIAVVFIWSGTIKIFDPESFGVIIKAFGIIPDFFVVPMAVMLPVLEVLVGAALMIDIYGSLAIISWLIGLFMGVLFYGIWMGLDIDCGCFGPEDPELEAFHGLRQALYRDLIVSGGIIYLYLWRHIRSVKQVRFSQIIKKKFKGGLR
ncbi:MauE/DoxX family redox-associated membrane protein [Thermodesulfobacteriota bacterium]